jgi:carboxyl-terminal processing protease
MKKVSLLTTITVAVATIVVTFNLTALFFLNYYNQRLSALNEKEKELGKLAAVTDIYLTKYLGEPDFNQMLDYAAYGLVLGSGDKYGVYFDQTSFEQMNKKNDGKLVGIGVMGIEDPDTKAVKVVKVLSDSPAQKNAMQIGDLIIEVEGEATSQIGYNAALSRIAGEENTVVQLTIQRKNEIIPMSITRDIVTTEPVTYRVIEDNIAYISINDFDANTPDAFRAALEQGMALPDFKGFIFDIRNNPGGELSSIVKVTDALVGEGTVVKLVDKNNEEEVYTSDAKQVDTPMVVLINENTASAAELFASVIRDFNKGPLVGNPTYGKWVSQSIIPLGDGSGMSVTDRRFYSPNGDNYNEVGISPDYEVEFPEELWTRFYDLTDREDPQLMQAIRLLK